MVVELRAMKERGREGGHGKRGRWKKIRSEVCLGSEV